MESSNTALSAKEAPMSKLRGYRVTVSANWDLIVAAETANHARDKVLDGFTFAPGTAPELLKNIKSFLQLKVRKSKCLSGK